MGSSAVCIVEDLQIRAHDLTIVAGTDVRQQALGVELECVDAMASRI